MLSMRLGGDPGETAALITAMRAAGIEVQVDNAKARREGITHTYAMVRLADRPAGDRDPIRVDAELGEPPRELPAGRGRRRGLEGR